MLTRLQRAQRGVTLIELFIGIGIAGILLVLALPNFTAWIQNTQIRNAAEAIQNGLQLARTEAVRRNANVQFALTSVAAGGTASDWTVSCVTPVADTDGDGLAECPGAGVVPTEIQTRPSAEGSRNAVVAAAQTTFVFSSMGRLTPVPGAAIDIAISNPAGGTCAAAGGTGLMRCLSVVVSTGGQVRMCDHLFDGAVPPNPRGCS